MSLAGCLQQDVAQARTGPDQRIDRDADLLGNLVGGLEDERYRQGRISDVHAPLHSGFFDSR
jgi:hypothetical protein